MDQIKNRVNNKLKFFYIVAVFIGLISSYYIVKNVSIFMNFTITEVLMYLVDIVLFVLGIFFIFKITKYLYKKYQLKLSQLRLFLFFSNFLFNVLYINLLMLENSLINKGYLRVSDSIFSKKFLVIVGMSSFVWIISTSMSLLDTTSNNRKQN